MNFSGVLSLHAVSRRILYYKGYAESEVEWMNEWSLLGLQEGFSVLSYTNALVIVYNRKKYLTILIYKWILNFIYSKKKAFSLKLQIYNNHRAKLQLTTWKI